MSQTLTRNLIHIIFSTKGRRELITPDIEPDLFAYIGGACRALESPLLGAGGTANHVHLLVSISKNLAVAELLMNIKKDSSKWLKTQGQCFGSFGWQDGYAALSIGESGVDGLLAYFARQKDHHRTTTFQQELIEFLQKYNVKYDERYIWT